MSRMNLNSFTTKGLMGDWLLHFLHPLAFSVRSGKGFIAEGSGSTLRLRSGFTNQAEGQSKEKNGFPH